MSVAVQASDPDVRVGHLDNGLTYYIRHNETPARSVDFFIAQRVGSVNEEECQRGLAHFLEHMCFNGTEHFPGNTLVPWLESVGVRFGSNVNAYTSTDETVYNICKVPSARTSVLDSCIMILSDWSHGLTLDKDEIDAERGVIVNEWRHRSSAANRMLERALPELYPGSRYGERMPIGKMEVVENFKPEELRSYYEKWYYPANQAVVVVGDIDPDMAEESIRRHFGKIVTAADAPMVKVYDVPDNDELIVVTEKDPEQHVNMVQMHFKHDQPEVKEEVALSLAGSMLAARFDELERSAECPHTYLGVGDSKYFMSRPQRSFIMRGVVKAGRAADAVETWTRELRRVLLHGFTDEELVLAKKEHEAKLSAEEKKISKTGNTEYARRYVRNFLDGEEPVAIADRIEAERNAMTGINAEYVSRLLKDYVDLSGKNAVILSYRPDNESTPDIAASELASAFKRSASSDPEAYVASAIPAQLLTQEPAKGSIVSTDSLRRFSAKEYRLSNGIKVLARYNGSATGQIYVRGVGPGGLSQEYSQELGATMKLLNDGISVSATGNFTAQALKRFLTGRNIKVSASVSNTEEIVEASTDREGMRDAFKLMYLKATDMRRDDDAYRMYAEQRRNGLKNLFANPTQVMGDSIHRNVYCRHPLGAKETCATVDEADYVKMMEIYKRRFEDMSDFTFYVAGDFDEDTLRSCLESYVATLPTAGRMEHPRDIGYRFTRGNHVVEFEREMETPHSVVYTFYTTPAEYELGNVMKASAFGRIIQMRLLEELREKRGWTYSVKCHCSISVGMNGDDPSCLLMPVYVKVEPDHEDECAAIVEQTVREIAGKGPTSAEVRNVKGYLSKNFDESIDDNAYWLLVMKNFVKFGKDMHNGYLDLLSEMSAGDIKAFGRKVAESDRTRVVMKGIAKSSH